VLHWARVGGTGPAPQPGEQCLEWRAQLLGCRHGFGAQAQHAVVILPDGGGGGWFRKDRMEAHKQGEAGEKGLLQEGVLRAGRGNLRAGGRQVNPGMNSAENPQNPLDSPRALV